MPTKEMVKKKEKKVTVYQCRECGQKLYDNLTCPSCSSRYLKYLGYLFLTNEIRKGLPSKG